MTIKEITNYTGEVKVIINDLLKFLVHDEITISEPMLKEMISFENSHLFFAIDATEKCMGMLTIGIYISPTGKKAWIEDVVVSESFRGQGVGNKLMEFAINFVKKKEVSLLMLTSNPLRIAANNLYVKLGFEKKETNVYKMTF